MQMSTTGGVEVLMQQKQRMLMLERVYMAGLGPQNLNSLLLYVIDTRQPTDTLNIAALEPGNHRPTAKTKVADFTNFAALARLDKTEGMCGGPNLSNGNKTFCLSATTISTHCRSRSFWFLNFWNPHHEHS